MEVEEGEAIVSPEREVQQPAYDMMEESRTCVEEMVAKILFVKKEGRPKSELRELISQISLLFVNLRQVNRSILMEEDRVKAETERAKAPVDFTTLQLHNLMYEKNHYLKAIKACKDFKSKHPNIKLVPEEEFFSTAPEEIKGNSVSKDNPHDLMLKRLNFEVFQRKELCKRHEELEQRKKSLQETIANRKKFLSSLPSHLKSLKKASMPVQHQLGIFHTKKLKQHHSAELLPPPLYVLYSQLLARKEAFGDKIDLEIVGNMKEAQAFVRQQANKDTADWWIRYGSSAPHLQQLAVKVLSLTCSSSGCERNWSAFEHIHSKRRNRLEHKRLNDLVYVRYNQILHHRYQKRDSIDPISLKDIDDSNEWLTGQMESLDLDEGGDGTGAPDLIFPGEDLDWAMVSEAAGVDEPQARTRAKGKAPASTSNVYQRRGRASQAQVDEEEDVDVDEDEEEEEEEEEFVCDDDDSDDYPEEDATYDNDSL